MGHPDRKTLRERKKAARRKEPMLGRRSFINTLDLTPHNAVGKIRSSRFSLRYK